LGIRRLTEDDFLDFYGPQQNQIPYQPISLSATTSLVERVMRTINQRINIAQWSPRSALAVAKIRGAYYYNKFDVS